MLQLVFFVDVEVSFRLLPLLFFLYPFFPVWMLCGGGGGGGWGVKRASKIGLRVPLTAG